jgi:hypothetical protein
MGFEILYKYHERLDAGGYNKDEVKELKRKIGEPFEETPLDKLASAILSQLARRDIWVVDVEIQEYKKQKVNFRETKGGIVIKNRKFNLDNEANMVSQEVAVVPDTTSEQPHNALPLPVAATSRRPVKWVTLDSNPHMQFKAQQAGLQFTPNKRYPVFSEQADPRDKRTDKFGQPSLERKMVYTMFDDRKREVTVSADYFASAEINLLGDREIGFTNSKEDGPKLMFDGEIKDSLPDLRGRR